MSQPLMRRRADLFSDGIPPRRRHYLVAGAAFLMITKENLPMRTIFFRDQGIVASDHAADGGGVGAGSGAEPVRYL
jgi:hypothetical protein